MAFETIITLIQSLAVAIITLLIGFIIAKLAGKFAKRVFAEAELNRILQTAGFKPFSDSLGMLIEISIYVITILIVLQQLGLTTLVIGIISAVAILFIGISITLACRDFIPNFITGIFLRKQLKTNLGKNVTIGIVTGKLTHIGLSASTIENHSNHYVPHLYTARKTINPK